MNPVENSFDWQLSSLGIGRTQFERYGERYPYLYDLFARIPSLQSELKRNQVDSPGAPQEFSLQQLAEFSFAEGLGWMIKIDAEVKRRTNDVVERLYYAAATKLAKCYRPFSDLLADGLSLYRRNSDGTTVEVLSTESALVPIVEILRSAKPESYHDCPVWAPTYYFRRSDLYSHTVIYGNDDAYEEFGPEIVDKWVAERKKAKRAALHLLISGKLLQESEKNIAKERTGPAELSMQAEDSLSTKRKNTYLVIIAAMAKELGIETAQSTKAANSISVMTQQIGAELTPEAIAKNLKDIPDALSRRRR